jgi:hypothetical protein
MTGELARTRSRRDRRGEDLVALVVGIVGALWRLRLELGLVALLVCAGRNFVNQAREHQLPARARARPCPARHPSARSAQGERR